MFAQAMTWRLYVLAAPASAFDALYMSASVSGQAHKLVLRIHDKLPAGVATMAVGLPGAPAVDLPAWGEITPAAASDKAPADSHEDDA